MPTRDSVTLQRIQTMHPKLRAELLTIYGEIQATGVNVRFTHTLRTFAEQDALYAIGRTKPGKKVTWAKSGASWHQWGLAVDFCLLLPDKTVSWDMNKDMDFDKIKDWVEVVGIFKRHGWEWGGDFVGKFDGPHLEKRINKLTITQALAMYKAGKVDKDGYLLL